MKKICVATVFFLAALSVLAVEKYQDPDAPEVHAAAKQALQNAKVVPIIGITRGIAGVINELGGKIIGQEIKMQLSADVLFDFNKADLKPIAIPTLQKVAQVVKSYAGTPVLIEGHTDSVGSDEYNQKLSEQRANSVRTWLQMQGAVEQTRMSIKGLGETKPAVPNTKLDGSDDPDGRAKNRRVELTIKTKGGKS